PGLVGELDDDAARGERLRRHAAAKVLDVAVLLDLVGEVEAALGQLGRTDVPHGDDLALLDVAAVDHAGQGGELAQRRRHGRLPDAPGEPAGGVVEDAAVGL